MDSLLKDLRYGIQMLTRNPGFTVAALLTLALGFGANTAIFSVVHGVLVRPLPYGDPSRIVRAFEADFAGSGRSTVSPANFLDWREQAESFEQLVAYRFGTANFKGQDGPERLSYIRASHGLFRVLGIQPQLGRSFGAEEDRPGEADVLVLSDELWRLGFGADPEVLGRSITLDGRSFSVIGVMPPGFAFPTPDVAYWAPLALDPTAHNRGGHFLRVVGRLESRCGGISQRVPQPHRLRPPDLHRHQCGRGRNPGPRTRRHQAARDRCRQRPHDSAEHRGPGHRSQPAETPGRKWRRGVDDQAGAVQRYTGGPICRQER